MLLLWSIWHNVTLLDGNSCYMYATWWGLWYSMIIMKCSSRVPTPAGWSCMVFHNVTRSLINRARRQSGFPMFISCQRQDVNVLPKRRQSHQGDKLCDVSTVPLVACWPVFLARGSDADSKPHLSINCLEGWSLSLLSLIKHALNNWVF